MFWRWPHGSPTPWALCTVAAVSRHGLLGSLHPQPAQGLLPIIHSLGHRVSGMVLRGTERNQERPSPSGSCPSRGTKMDRQISRMKNVRSDQHLMKRTEKCLQEFQGSEQRFLMGNLGSFKGRGHHPGLFRWKLVEETHIHRQKDKCPSKVVCGVSIIQREHGWWWSGRASWKR